LIVQHTDSDQCKQYCNALTVLTHQLPPTFLVKFGEGRNVVTNEI
jgi:hypothetical protein